MFVGKTFNYFLHTSVLKTWKKKHQYILQSLFFKIGIHSKERRTMPLQGMELQEKEEEKDESHIMLFRKNPKIKGV